MLTKLQETINAFNDLPCRTGDEKRRAREWFLNSLNEWLKHEPNYMIELIITQITIELCGYSKHPAIRQALDMLEGMIILRQLKPEIKALNEHDNHV